MKNQKIGVRLGLVFSFLIAVLIGIGWLGLDRMGQNDSDMEALVNKRWAKVQLSREALNYSTINNRITMQIFLVQDREELDALLARRAENSDRITDLIKQLEGRLESNEEKELLEATKSARTPYVESYKQAINLLVNEKKYEAARNILVKETMPRLADYHRAWDAFVQFEGEQMGQAVKESDVSDAAALRVTFFLIVLSVVITAAIAVFVTRSMIRDINRRKQAEAALQQALAGAQASEQRYRQLADAMPQIVWTAAPDGEVDYYNQQWFDYTGLTLEQTQGWGWQFVVHPDDLEQCLEHWCKAFQSGTDYEVKYRFKRGADGVYRWQLGRASAVRDGQGRIVKWFGTCTDIDEQKQLEDKLLSAREEMEARVIERTAELAMTNEALRAEVAERLRAEESMRESEERYR